MEPGLDVAPAGGNAGTASRSLPHEPPGAGDPGQPGRGHEAQAPTLTATVTVPSSGPTCPHCGDRRRRRLVQQPYGHPPAAGDRSHRRHGPTFACRTLPFSGGTDATSPDPTKRRVGSSIGGGFACRRRPDA